MELVEKLYSVLIVIENELSMEERNLAVEWLDRSKVQNIYELIVQSSKPKKWWYSWEVKVRELWLKLGRDYVRKVYNIRNEIVH